MVTGWSGSSAVNGGFGRPTNRRTASSFNSHTRRFWWLVKNPSYATMTGRRTFGCSPILKANRFIS